MKIVLCIKQIPDTSDIKWTENNTINREGVESILNPLDLYAIETALKLKERVKDCEINVVSMGPLQALEVIKRAIALGCDKGYLLSDKKFAGSDTYATAKTLANFIKTKVPDFDLVLCGQFAADGDTAQTGPSLARQLNLPQLTYVKSVKFKDNKLFVERETETEIEKYEVEMPTLLCITKSEQEIRRAKISGFIKAKSTEIEILSCTDIGMDSTEAGIKGSPTYVSKAFTPKITRENNIYINENISETVKILKTRIEDYV